MKRNLTHLLISLCLLPLAVFGQNLVPDPSFEQLSDCPYGPGQTMYNPYWSSYRLSPDIFNSCAPGNFGSGVGVPFNIWGYTPTHSGDGYIGLYVMQLPYVDAREFIGCTLLSPLEVGKQYVLSMHVCLSDNPNVKIASSSIGIRFFDTDYAQGWAPLDNYFHLVSDSIHTDTASWYKIEGTFIPDTAFQYMAIGNFRQDDLSDTIQVGTGTGVSYYFIDDIYVGLDSTVSVATEPQPVRPVVYPNPAADHFFIDGLSDSEKDIHIFLYNTAGALVREIKTTSQPGIMIDRGDLTSGLYLLRIESDGHTLLHQRMLFD